MKVKVIVVSHGSFSKGVVNSVQMLAGEQEDFVAYGLYPEQTVTDLTQQLEEELKNTSEGKEVIFLSDLFHGSPFNAVVSLMKNYKFSHITGINIPLTVALILERYSGGSAQEICETVLKDAPDTIKDVSKLFDNEEDEEEEELKILY